MEATGGVVCDALATDDEGDEYSGCPPYDLGHTCSKDVDCSSIESDGVTYETSCIASADEDAEDEDICTIACTSTSPCPAAADNFATVFEYHTCDGATACTGGTCNSDTDQCEACEAGRYDAGSSFGCMPCMPGQYTSSIGATACTMCS
eukprot:SAG31_NODE_21879_length_538_cov_2.077449_1_plen_148_part_10